MDIDFLSFQDEQFTTLDSIYSPSLLSDSDEASEFPWAWDREIELNGDIALIPVKSHVDTDVLTLSTSPPAKGEFQKIMSEWQCQFTLDGFNMEDISTPTDVKLPMEHIFTTDRLMPELLLSNDIEPLKNEPSDIEQHEKVYSSDFYKVEETTAVENSDCMKSPVLLAQDVDSLLEKFEATEPLVSKATTSVPPVSGIATNVPDTSQNQKITINSPSFSENKKILDALPEELISHIRSSGKHTSSSEKSLFPRSNSCRTLQEAGAVKLNTSEIVLHDHDYCSSPSPKHTKRDSGFVSAEEDERSTIKNQPTVKNIDGKLMVSLLKSKTVRHEEARKKRKLNLEEYKKRREILAKNNIGSFCYTQNESFKVTTLRNINRVRLSSFPIISPVQHFEEIKPLLKTASSKITSSSLITSLIQNIPELAKEHNILKQSDSVSCEIVSPEQDAEKRVKIFQHQRSRRCRSMSCCSRSRSSSHSSRTPSPRPTNLDNEQQREVEERRIVYVGGIVYGTTQEQLRSRFKAFGPISKISVHFREQGSNYGFVTFAKRADAYQAVEHGNDNIDLPRYDLSFGGRRAFCQSHYHDLDDIGEMSGHFSRKEDSFDNLLREAQAKLLKRRP